MDHQAWTLVSGVSLYQQDWTLVSGVSLCDYNWTFKELVQGSGSGSGSAPSLVDSAVKGLQNSEPDRRLRWLDSRFWGVERVGAVADVLGAVEDPVGQTCQEVPRGQVTCDGPHREARAL